MGLARTGVAGTTETIMFERDSKRPIKEMEQILTGINNVRSFPVHTEPAARLALERGMSCIGHYAQFARRD